MYLCRQKCSSIAVVSMTLAACAFENGPTERLTKEHGSQEARLTVQAILNNRLFGTFCAQDFQNSWQNYLYNSFNTCYYWNQNAASELAPQAFYWNLHGAASAFTSSGDATPGSGIDTVDILFLNTHGGLTDASGIPSPSSASFAMWDQGSLVTTPNMSLGDSDRGLSILATHSCDTLASDGHLIDRWWNVFDGGLRLSVGSPRNIYSTSYNTSDGSRFADNLAANQTVEDAWKNALHAAQLDNDAASVATGTDADNCQSRLRTTTWGNYIWLPRLRQFDWHVMCQDQWLDL